jgi:hypothetical protein
MAKRASGATTSDAALKPVLAAKTNRRSLIGPLAQFSF